jgi:hypothetical protein
MLFRVETNIQHPRSNFKKVKKNKKLPTFCVFCKVIVLSVNKKVNKTALHPHIPVNQCASIIPSHSISTLCAAKRNFAYCEHGHRLNEKE